MSPPNLRRMTVEEFFEWGRRRPDGERWELVDGIPLHAMTGARRAHNVVANNITVALTPAAKARGCDATTSDTGVRTGARGVRYPDVVIDCAPPDPDATQADAPTIVVEVASPSTSEIDGSDKLEEYRAVESIRVVLLVELGTVDAKLYRRGTDGEWSIERYGRLDQIIELPEIGATLAVADVYDTLAPHERPDLRAVDPDES